MKTVSSLPKIGVKGNSCIFYVWIYAYRMCAGMHECMYIGMDVGMNASTLEPRYNVVIGVHMMPQRGK